MFKDQKLFTTGDNPVDTAIAAPASAVNFVDASRTVPPMSELLRHYQPFGNNR